MSFSVVAGAVAAGFLAVVFGAGFFEVEAEAAGFCAVDAGLLEVEV